MKINLCILLSAAILATSTATSAQPSYVSISDPDGKTTVYVGSNDGVAWYSIDHGRSLSIPASRLGLKTDAFDWSELELRSFQNDEIVIEYEMDRGKASKVHRRASTGTATFANPKGENIHVEFIVSRNDVAFRYLIPREGETGAVRVLEELTEFNFADNHDNSKVSTYLTPQNEAMSEWKRAKPSYEEYYGIGRPLSEESRFGCGYTFPCLFHIKNDGWVLISETGVDGKYCGSRMSEIKLASTDDSGSEDRSDDKLYYSCKIEYPMFGENNGNGTSEPGIALPGTTPWRTLTLGENLKPIVETTIPWDVVDQKYETEHEYRYGKGSWSWIVWQDQSINWEDQIAYADLAAAMGWDHMLVDARWDQNIGYEKMEELIAYAGSKGVAVYLWYNSAGAWNDTDHTPAQIMNDPIARKKEMKWMSRHGVRGIKVDFFGGDKQETMRLYEDILSDAEIYGIQVYFHGCTLPRGWEKMYPNYVGSEAVRTSENLIFTQYDCDQEAQAACLHPFIRNAVGCMEFGGCFLNKRLDRTNSQGHIRRTTDVFQLATCILFQNPVQNFALAPNNLEDAPKTCIDFLKDVPTIWDETRFIDGYPGSYVALGRRKGNTWYIAAVNAEKEVRSFNIWEMIQELKEGSDNYWTIAENSMVRIYEGGDSPFVREVPAGDIYKTGISIAQNDGIVIIFNAE